MRNIPQILLTFCFILGANGLKITNMNVPKFVKNGTEESIVLDCEYEYDEKDLRLVIKWFHDNDPNPVYQWIPELNKVRSSDKFGDRVNIDYEVSSGNKLTNRRALNILWPTTEVSGTYSCHVTSLAGSDSKYQTMVVYAHPSAVYLNYTVDDDIVKVNCIVEGVFPIPNISMFQIEPGKMEHTPVEDIEMEYEWDEDSYNVVVSTNLTEEEAQTDSLRYFGCKVSIPGTSYNTSKNIPYFKQTKAEMVESEPEDGAANLCPVLFLLVCGLLFTRHAC